MSEYQPDLRVGIVSDVHIGFTGHRDPHYHGLGQIGDQDKWWEYTLRWFKNRGVDVIAVPGDMTNACDYSIPSWSADYSSREMTRFYEIFRKVFDGTETQLVTIYGNHDQFVQKWERANGGDRTPWQDVFGEPYERAFVKRIKGYSFIGAHWDYEPEAKNLVDAEALRDPERPVFYLQHGPLANTTIGSDPTRYGEVYTEYLDIVRGFENVIVLSGHSHAPITDERAIWQSEAPDAPKCTSITCSTLNYGFPEDAWVEGENICTKQGLYLTVTGKDIRVERVSFWTERMIGIATGGEPVYDYENYTRSCGADWEFTVGGEKVYDFTRRTKTASVPEFPENANLGIRRGDTVVELRFPAAIPMPCDDDLIQSYHAEAVDADGNVVSEAAVCTEHHVDHSGDYLSPYYHITLFGLNPNTEYTFRVYASGCFRKSEHPLTITAKTLASVPTHLK